MNRIIEWPHHNDNATYAERCHAFFVEHHIANIRIEQKHMQGTIAHRASMNSCYGPSIAMVGEWPERSDGLCVKDMPLVPETWLYLAKCGLVSQADCDAVLAHMGMC
jgi:hypothetical protein